MPGRISFSRLAEQASQREAASGVARWRTLSRASRPISHIEAVRGLPAALRSDGAELGAFSGVAQAAAQIAPRRGKSPCPGSGTPSTPGALPTWNRRDRGTPLRFPRARTARLMGLEFISGGGGVGAGYAMPPSRRECLIRAGSILSALLGGKGAMAVEAQLLRMMDRLPESGAQSSFS